MGEAILAAEPAVRSWLQRAWHFMAAARGGRRWDLFLRATAALALLGIPFLVLVPSSAPLVCLAILSVPANGPLSPIMPVTFEPLIMEAAKYAAPTWVALVGAAAQAYAEVINFHLYRWVLTRQRLSGFRELRWVKRSVSSFARWPFATTVVFAFTPLPFWAARILAVLDRYSFPRYLLASVIGRLPRIFFYAWLGEVLRLPTWALGALIVSGPAAIVLWRLARRAPILNDVVLDAPEESLRSGGRGDVDPLLTRHETKPESVCLPSVTAAIRHGIEPAWGDNSQRPLEKPEDDEDEQLEDAEIDGPRSEEIERRGAGRPLDEVHDEAEVGESHVQLGRQEGRRRPREGEEVERLDRPAVEG